MASWDRYGEDKKYKSTLDTNVNPKHVGESLRVLTAEDRLELRRISREQEKKRVSRKAVSDDEEEAIDDGAEAPKAANGKPTSEKVDLADDDDLVVGSVTDGRAAVQDLIDADDIVQIPAANGARKPANQTKATDLDAPTSIIDPPPAKKARVRQRPATPVGDVVALDAPPSKDAVVALDDDGGAAAAARRARRRANIEAAKAAPPAPTPLLQVLE